MIKYGLMDKATGLYALYGGELVTNVEDAFLVDTFQHIESFRNMAYAYPDEYALIRVTFEPKLIEIVDSEK